MFFSIEQEDLIQRRFFNGSSVRYLFFIRGRQINAEKISMRRRFFNLIRPYRNLLQPEFTQFHSEFTEFHSKIKWICLDLNKFNATPNLLDSINQWRAENLFHQNLFFNRAGQINQWPEQKSMKSFPTKIFFYSGRPNQLINAELFRQGRYDCVVREIP